MSASFSNVIKNLFQITDEQAMWRVQTEDDPDAFAVIVSRWKIPLHHLCTRMVGDQHKAEDLTQEAFSRLFLKRKVYEPKGKLSTYLWRITLNLCYDELRRLKRRRENVPNDAYQDSILAMENFVSPDPVPGVEMESNEQAAQVRAALDSLSDSHRSVLVLRHYENLKFREIAEVLEIPEGTVKSRMAEALSQMAKALQHPQKETASAVSKTRSKLQPILAL